MVVDAAATEAAATESAATAAASTEALPTLILYPHSGRLRKGFFLVSVCVALYGGWHWFGSSGLGLVVLWLQVRLGERLATTENARSSEDTGKAAGTAAGTATVSLDLNQVVWVRVDPWRVTVSLSNPCAGANGGALHPVRMGLRIFRRRRVEFFRDELDATTWAQLRRSLLEAASPMQRARTPAPR